VEARCWRLEESVEAEGRGVVVDCRNGLKKSGMKVDVV
jgi:hypothetical protein